MLETGNLRQKNQEKSERNDGLNQIRSADVSKGKEMMKDGI